MKGFRVRPLATVALAAVLMAGCSDDDNNASSDEQDYAAAEALEPVPLVGEILADCTDGTLAVIEDFIEGAPALISATNFGQLAGVGGVPLPVLGDILTTGNEGAQSLPIIGVLFAEAGGATALPIDALAGAPQFADLLPSVPVLGQIPVTCEDGLVPVNANLDFAGVLGAIPVFGPAAEGAFPGLLSNGNQLLGVILPVFEALPGGNPLEGVEAPIGAPLPALGQLPIDLGQILADNVPAIGFLDVILGLLPL